MVNKTDIAGSIYLGSVFLERVQHTSRCGGLVGLSQIVQVSNLLIVSDREEDSAMLNTEWKETT
jgi:hypothetical protein